MVTWAIQSGFGVEDGERLRTACRWLGSPVREFSCPPFSDELPDVPVNEGPVVFYGSPRVGTIVAASTLWKPGVFGDPIAFEFPTQRDHWCDRLLNADASLVSLADLAGGMTPVDAEQVFYRPIGDNKLFDGDTATPEELREWANRMADSRSGGLSEETTIVVSAARDLGSEWRLFVVDGKVVSSSRYRISGSHDIGARSPNRVMAFGEELAAIWSPDPVFTLDVTEVGDELFAVEANGFNGCGFYASDVGAIVNAVNDYVTERFDQ